MKRLAIAAMIVALHTPLANATEAAHGGAVAANWCNYLGPDCRPYGLSHKAKTVFRYLTQPEGMSGVDRYDASRELLRTQEQVALGDRMACKEVRDITRAMQHSPSPDMRRWGRGLASLADRRCD